MARKMPDRGLQELVGKQVFIKQQYEDNREGPFLFLGIDQGFLKFKLNDEEFWWNSAAIAGIRLYVQEKEEELSDTKTD